MQSKIRFGMLAAWLVLSAGIGWQIRQHQVHQSSRVSTDHQADRSGPRVHAPPAAPATAPLPQTGLSLTHQPPTSGIPAARPSAVKAFPYRLRNTALTMGELMRRDTAVLLRNALLDTSVAGRPVIPAHLAAVGDPEAYILQARKPLDDAFRQRIASEGATIISYIPNNAYLVRMPATTAQRLEADAGTQAVLPLEPYYKLDSALLTLAVEAKPLPNGRLNLLLFPGERDRVAQDLARLGAQIFFEENTPFGPLAAIHAPPDSLPALAALPGVQSIEPFRERRSANDMTRLLTGVSPDLTTAAPAGNHLGLTGAGVTVAISDTGVDAAHPDLAGRVTGLTVDNNGHGTHVAGTIASDGKSSPSGADYRGMAPAARIYSLPWALSAGDTYVQQQAARSNLFLLNNSWVYGDAYDYDIHAASFDSAVRDALPGDPGSQPLAIVFAAGDQGDGTADGQGGTAGSIQSPATGKNVITVGASELMRNITNLVTFRDRYGNATTNRVWEGITDSFDEVAGFSARGNVARGVEGDSGRFKPDVVAPGAMVISCKASAYDYPAYFSYANDNTIADLTLPAGSTNLNAVTVPDNAVSFTILMLTNAFSPVPFPNVSIMATNGGAPTAANFVGYNAVTLTALTPGTLYYSLGNGSGAPVHYDFRTIMIMTNDAGNFFTVLSNLNQSLGPQYRYDWGTSMSAASVSGLLALMQEYFQTKLGLTNPSPALRKALLINGARAVGPDYDFQTSPVINHQGWGLVHLTNSVPSGLSSNSGPVRFFEQSPADALTTGQSHTRTVNLSGLAQFADLRFTLVWTDPPGNPLASVKLVNDLDLIVTNLDTGEVFLGNHFGEDSHYSQVLNATETNQVLIGDRVNNVENVFLQGPTSTRYSVTVNARRVHVNAVSNHPDGIVQDYALVISTANPSAGSALVVGATPTVTSNTAPLVSSSMTFSATQPLFYYRAGANSPLLGGFNGTLSQWTFFVYTNRTSGTNTIATFIPPNLSSSRVAESDIDLYVSRDYSLTNLNPAAIAAAYRSVGRGGTEYIIFTNAQPGEVFYVGVKSEDQQAGEFGVGAFDGGGSGQLDENGNLVLRLGPVEVPDGLPDDPGGTNAVTFAMMPMTIQRVIVTNTLTHENGGDLIGILSHDSQYAVLNSHADFTDTKTWVYDDSGQGDILGSGNTDGPGSLQSFLGEQALGMWEYNLTDNALHHTGRLDQLTLVIEPTSTNANYPVYLTRLLGAGGFLDTAINVPANATNLEICVSATGPVDVYVRNSLFTSVTAGQYDYTWSTSGNLCTNINLASVPPLAAGRYEIHVENPGNSQVRVTVSARFMVDFRSNGLLTFESVQKVDLVDDAMTNSTLTVTNTGLVTAVEVGVRLNHPRASDLVLHLVSPQGQRILLSENRGFTNSLGYGTAEGMDMIYVGFTENTNLAAGPIKFGVPPFTNMLATQTMVVDFCGFEKPLAQIYNAGSVVEGWTVVSNAVSIARDTNFAHTGAQLLALSTGRITRKIPTLAGHHYRLTMAYHDPGTVGWWRGENNTADLINGNTGTIFSTVGYGGGEVGQAFNFTAGNNQKISLAEIPDYQMTNSLTIESWINLRTLGTGVRVIFFRGNWEDDRDPYKIMVENDGQVRFVVGTATAGALPPWAQYLVTTTTVPLNTWTHVVGTLDGTSGKMSVYLNSTLSATLNTSVRPYGSLTAGTFPGIAIGNHSSTQTGNPTRNSPFNGLLDEITLYKRALTDAEIRAIYNAGAAGKVDALTPVANAQFQLVGFTNQTLLGDRFWRTNTVVFTATSNQTTLNLSGKVMGMLFDTLSVEEVPKDSWYLPEEPLTPLVGQSSAGQWTLEIWDTRAGGAVTNGSLIAWHLNLGIANPGIQPAAVVAGAPQTGSVAANAIAYYKVEIPYASGVAANLLVSDGTPLNLVLNEQALPTGASAGDVTLLSNTTNGQAVVQAGVFPLASSTYYLGVMNADPASTNTSFSLQVGLSPGAPPRVAVVAPGDPTVAFEQQGFSLTWSAPRWQRFQVQYTDSLVEAWKTIPGVITSPNGQFVFGDDGTLTGSLTRTRFYRLILAE